MGMSPNCPADCSRVRPRHRQGRSAQDSRCTFSTGIGFIGSVLAYVLGHTKDSLWSADLFRCESLTLRTHWVLVVMDQFTRRIIGFGIHRGNVDGNALCRMFQQAIWRKSLPKYLSTDNDPLYRFHQWQANLRVLEVTEIKTVPGVPVVASIHRKIDRDDTA